MLWVVIAVLVVLGGCAAPEDPAAAMARQRVSTVVANLLRANDDLCRRSQGRCDFDLKILPSPGSNAVFGESWLLVTTGLVQFAHTDDNLAITVGHEVAHLMLGHVYQRGSGRRDQEYEADDLGLYLIARAGYKITGAADFLERAISSAPSHFRASMVSEGYPPMTERVDRMRATQREIEAKRAAGQPLVPTQLSR